MLTEIKIYKSDKVPNENTLRNALMSAKLHDVIIRIEWFVQYSGKYYIDVNKDDIIEDLLEKLPKVYGM